MMKISLWILFLLSLQELSLGGRSENEFSDMDYEAPSYQDKLDLLENIDSMTRNAEVKRNPFIRRQQFIDMKRSPFMQRQNFMENKRSPFMQRQSFMESKRSPFAQR